MARPYSGAKPWKPYPSQLEALRAVADGCSLSEGGRKIGLEQQDMASRISSLYTRLGITADNAPGHHLSQHRRWVAIKICKDHGWWPEEHKPPTGDAG